MVLKKAAIVAPTLPRETVPVPALGGDVVVRGLRLSERLAMSMNVTQAERFRMVPVLLALCVVDAAGDPVVSEDQWEDFGAVHLDAAMTLFDVAKRLSGMDEDALKKS